MEFRIALYRVPGPVAWFLANQAALMAAGPATATTSGERIGIFDSRAVAYAHFWSEPFQRDLQQRVAAAKVAREKGDSKQLEALRHSLREEQRRLHLQVFSTAPID